MRLDRIRVLVLILALLLGAVTVAQALTPSKYRKLNGEEGNCIFSTADLPLADEDSYKDVRTAFRSGEHPVQTRCYFPAAMSEMAQRGSVYNELRDDLNLRVYVQIESPDRSPNRTRSVTVNLSYKDFMTEWERIRFFLDPGNADCTVKALQGFSGECLDLEQVARKMAEEDKASLPYTITMCITPQYSYANSTERRFDEQREVWVEAPVLETHAAASGCLDYTVH